MCVVDHSACISILLGRVELVNSTTGGTHIQQWRGGRDGGGASSGGTSGGVASGGGVSSECGSGAELYTSHS